MHRKIWKMRCFIILMIMSLLIAGCSDRSEGEHIELEEAKIEGTEEELKETEEVQEEDSLARGNIYVHVCGAVISPGVYMLPAGSRMYEAIEAAGGLTEEAAEESLNQAAAIEDGQQIYVLSREEAIQRSAAGVPVQGTEEQDDGKIDLNTASKEQLMTLTGIGEAKASAIISYREEHGGFQKAEELMEVEGIKEGTYNKIKDQIKI